MSKSPTQSLQENRGDVLPEHIAIIMDGNGRWARRRGLPRVAGHRKGVETVRTIIQACAKRNIPWLTIFAFSSENWRRPKKEVELLMDLFIQALDKEIQELHQNNIQFRIIGDISPMSQSIKDRVAKSEEITRDNSGLTLSVALNYGGRWDITEASRQLVQDILDGKKDIESINEEAISGYLSTGGIPDPDLFIRTGGEKRISNFLLWQLAYTELYFTDAYWPDFNETELQKALDSYSQRQRRYGQTGEQVGIG
ncbi:MAG: isoprenyl transferase [Acidiferrobacterales bacterium]